MNLKAYQLNGWTVEWKEDEEIREVWTMRWKLKCEEWERTIYLKVKWSMMARGKVDGTINSGSFSFVGNLVTLFWGGGENNK